MESHGSVSSPPKGQRKVVIVKRREMGIAEMQVIISAALVLLVENPGAQEGRGLHLELK